MNIGGDGPLFQSIASKRTINLSTQTIELKKRPRDMALEVKAMVSDKHKQYWRD